MKDLGVQSGSKTNHLTLKIKRYTEFFLNYRAQRLGMPIQKRGMEKITGGLLKPRLQEIFGKEFAGSP